MIQTFVYENNGRAKFTVELAVYYFFPIHVMLIYVTRTRNHITKLKGSNGSWDKTDGGIKSEAD